MAFVTKPATGAKFLKCRRGWKGLDTGNEVEILSKYHTLCLISSCSFSKRINTHRWTFKELDNITLSYIMWLTFKENYAHANLDDRERIGGCHTFIFKIQTFALSWLTAVRDAGGTGG